jgi:hypothetical protein
MNTIVNRGQGTRAVLHYLEKIEDLIQGEVPLENEIVEKF